MDEKGAAMKGRLATLAVLALLTPWRAQAHLGSPDVFFDGTAGPYPVSVAIRMPAVVPGRAQISVRVRSNEAVAVAVAPIAAATSVSNTPPPEVAQPVPGETNLFAGELWLMVNGAYGIDIRVRGPSGNGAVQVPVNSVATHQLPLPSWLGGMLLALAAILFCAGVAIIAAAAGESVLPPGAVLDKRHRRRYRKAATIATFVFAAGLVLGRNWWNSDEADFRSRLREGGWPDLAARIHLNGSQRILNLSLSDSSWKPKDLTLEADHGKLLHTYLIRLPKHDVFAHIHPTNAGGHNSYDVALPPLPEGDYEILCDVTLANSGISSTATNVVRVPPISAGAGGTPLRRDPDDSWAVDSAVAARDNAGGDVVSRLSGGTQVIWKAHPPLRAQQEAGLRFEVRDEAGQPAALEPYMGMTSHAAVLRADGRVFAHLHPSGNYSMAAQFFFDTKLGKISATKSPDPICGVDHSGAATASGIIALPYEFPSGGDYRLWVQVKTGGRVETAIFDTTVQPASL
jgi:hypothetical protein